jgi:hypothetical protein
VSLRIDSVRDKALRRPGRLDVRRLLTATAATALLVSALAACGSSGTTSPSSASTATTPNGTSGSHGAKRVGRRCLHASPRLVHTIQLGLNGQGGKTLTHTYAVLSTGAFPKAPPSLRRHVYFVAASVLNRAHQPDIAVWVTGSLSGHALIYPASSLANDVSTFKNIGGSSSKPRALAYGITETSDGYKTAGKCVKDALAATR